MGQAQLANDMSAAYYNALAWRVSGDEAYARKSVEIMDAWSGECTQIVGSDAMLAAGIYGYKVANAAEIIRADLSRLEARECRSNGGVAQDGVVSGHRGAGRRKLGNVLYSHDPFDRRVLRRPCHLHARGRRL